ncbi:alpha/beta hydrolase-fold protein [Plantactinospora sp. KLBMP9567]|uniref:alpha/beta hydrolase-fold protein n=1 Tax=Plantactinospora sp. KLBMP9567 TaxID=3085900 RepID=UPI002981E296|nr:alpha/beta hydrolase-fold protein [Plantactinospora sp. KLBMP9567]MDW5328987.1 alpha/beta hydrolase-fold protein [Plantactinospora sp. KLBMP9567]
MRRPWRLGGVAGVLLLSVGLVGAVPGGAAAGRDRAGTLSTASAPSAALGSPIDYTVYLPYGYADRRNATVRYPVLYLLHGRGDTMSAWTRVKADLDRVIADGELPPVIAVLPDAPWSGRGSWYVDSGYTGADDPGRPVETALTRDLISYVDATYRTSAHRGARLVGGYSMGGAGALRYALAHQDLFANALVLSPAVYRPLPPSDSSAREYGAFGAGEERFSADVYRRLNYPALLPTLDPELPVRMFVAVGDDEWANPDPVDAAHDLDYEAATLYNTVRRSEAVAAQFRVVDGGHDWDVWRPSFVDGLRQLAPTLNATPPAGLPGPPLGSAGTDWAGGIAAAPDGGATIGYAASGPVGGQPYAGGLDAVVTRLGPDRRTPRWTTQFGTPANERLYGVVPVAEGEVLAAGYTRGDLDGAHPGSPADDGFVAKLTGTGERAWLTQLGDPTKADRFYAVAPAPDGGAYVAGYTSGAYGGTSAGDKDAILVRLGPDGRVGWSRQFGGPGEDKAYAVAADASGVYLAGSTSAGMPGSPHLGGTDGWLARFTPDGARQWTDAEGGTGDDLLTGLAVTTTGTVVATGGTGGEATVGGTDVLTVAYDGTGRQRWRTVSGGAGDDAGAEVLALPGGEVAVVGFTGSALGVPAGAADVLTLRLDRRGKQVLAAQYGTARDDAVDAFGEENVYATRAGDGKLLVSGLTVGTPAGGAALGSGDVFVASVDPTGGLP